MPSATYVFPSKSERTLYGLKNEAAVPSPSAKVPAPEPATVVTSPVSEILRNILPIAFLLIAREYYSLYSPLLKSADQDQMRQLVDLGIIFTSVFATGAYFGKKLERSIDSRIDRLEQCPGFAISKGDTKAAEEYQGRNKSLSSQIYGRVGLTLFGLTITSIAKACWGAIVGS